MDGDDLDDIAQFIFDPPQLSDVDDAEDAEDADNNGDDNGDNDQSPGDAAEDSDFPSSEAPPKRIVRRRARKACIACHKRKVRCDLLSRGHTCTNCRLDSITCVVRQTSGKRARRRRGGVAAEDVENTKKPAKRASAKKLSPKAAKDSHNEETILPTDEVTRPIAPGPEPSATNDVHAMTAATYPASGDGNYQSAFEAPRMMHNTHGDILYSYYDFIEAESISHIAPEDFKFLEYKGCFHLPARPPLDELVREYFLHVHPVFPLIDERMFWEAYSLNPLGTMRSPFKIPLLVFRAMIFVSCSYASHETIQRLGFHTPLDARNCMYQRAQLMYHFNTTSDMISLSQGAVIMTHYCSDREPMANTSWLRLAIQYANSAGVPNYDRDISISEQQRQTRKRLWWCIVLRDRILPLGVRRPIEIGHEQFDFSQPRLGESDLEHEFDSSHVYDKATKIELARILVAQIDLAVALTDVISLVYPATGFSSFDTLDYNAMRSMSPKVKQCMNALGRSYSAFQNSCTTPSQMMMHESVSLYNGLTRIYYQSARAALCQFASFMVQADDEGERNEKIKQLGSAMHASITTIADIVKECVQVKMARFLPVSMLAYLALPIILNSLDVKSLSSSNMRTEAKRRQLRLLNTAMDLYRERYSGAINAQKVITQTVEDTHAEQCTRTTAPESTTSLACQKPVGDWLDIFIHKPAEYLRLSFRIDISLASGCYPKTESLPQRLYFQLDMLSNTPITKSLAPPLEDYTNDNSQKLFETSAADNSYLDFLNLCEA